MEEGRAVAAEHHEAMGRVLELNPELWQNLPDDLVDIIVKKVLTKLPFSRVLGFCFLSKRWRALLLSTQYLLHFHSLDECMIFNPRTGVWGSMPLLFLPGEALELRHMKLVSCDRGLLYFASDSGAITKVCNPLTRLCCPSVRGPNAAQRISDAAGKVSKSTCPGWSVLDRWASSRGEPSIMIRFIARSDAGYFQLDLSKLYPSGTPCGHMQLKDSRRPGWVTVANVHNDFHFVVFPTILAGESNIMLGFHRTSRGRFNVLLYHVEQKRPHWDRDVSSLRDLVTVGMRRKILLATRSGGGEVEYFHFLDEGVTLAKEPFPPVVLQRNVLNNVVQSRRLFTYAHLERRDIVYNVWLIGDSPDKKIYISVRTENPLNGIERVSNWMEYWPSGWDSLWLNYPTSRNFHAFRPSLCPPDAAPE